MALSAQVSLWGLYQYDKTILNGLTVPSGMDGDAVKDALLLETASMEILYPDIPFLKAAISVWSAERKDVWDKLYETTTYQYDPIENYDRIEEYSKSGSGISDTDSTSSINSSSRRSSDNTQSGNSTSTTSQTAYNSASFADTAKTDSSGSNRNSNSENDTSEGISTNSGKIKNSNSEIFRSRVHGNIGVTTSQQMIESQRNVVQFCMTEFIINDFISRFCVAVY